MKVARVIITFCLLFGLLLSTTSAVAADRGGPDEFAHNYILVKFNDWADEDIKAQIHGKHSGLVIDSIPQIGVQIVRIPGRVWEKVKAYSGDAAVQYAEPDYIASVIPSDPYYLSGDQWGIDRIQAPAAWDETTGSPAIKIAILDTGVDQDHEDLADKIVANKKFAVTSRTVDDFYGHGTHVAGIAAAITDNGVGVAGVGWDCSIMNVKVLGDSGTGWYRWIAKGITWAADNGAKVINLSLGGYSSSSTLEDAVNYAWNKGVVIVAAAGNDNTNAPFYPAYYENCIAIAATDQNDNRAIWDITKDSASNYGGWVDVAAPGIDIVSTFPNHDNYWGYLNYVYWGGTSMATPHVAGLAGLTWATGYGTDNASVRNRIESTADEVGNIWGDYGIRRINAYEAVAPGAVNNPPTVSITTPTDGSTFDSGATILFEGTANDTEDGDLTGGLAWTSSIDGTIGTGGTFSTTLSDGSHTITASVTDSGGKTGNDYTNITVGSPPTLSVNVTTDKPSYVHGEKALITITVTDGTNPVEGAAVHVEVTAANQKKNTYDGTTDGNGTVQFRYRVNSKRGGVGTYTAEATASKSGYTSGSGSTSFEVNGRA